MFFLFFFFLFFFFQAEDGIRDAQESRGLGDVYKRQVSWVSKKKKTSLRLRAAAPGRHREDQARAAASRLAPRAARRPSPVGGLEAASSTHLTLPTNSEG